MYGLSLLVFTGFLSVTAASLLNAEQPPVSPDLLSQGAKIYQQQCAACHGVDGQGDGEAAYLLYPKPRNLVNARYRLVSTWEENPTDRDLFNTISRGMPGSSMPSWAHLPEEDRWAFVYYVKSFATGPLVVKPQKDPQEESSERGRRLPDAMSAGVILCGPFPC